MYIMLIIVYFFSSDNSIYFTNAQNYFFARNKDTKWDNSLQKKCCSTDQISLNHKVICSASHSDHNYNISTPRDKFPWQVNIQLKLNWHLQHLSSGALVSPKWVLSAANSVYNLNSDQLIVISRQTREVATIIVHPSFDKDTQENDLALLELKKPFIIGYDVSKICLQRLSIDQLCINKCHIGMYLHDEYFRNSLTVINKKSCEKIYKRHNLVKLIKDNMECVDDPIKNENCHGDAGAPIVCPDSKGEIRLSGMLSWGWNCADNSTPAVFTLVAPYFQWIKQQVMLEKDEVPLCSKSEVLFPSQNNYDSNFIDIDGIRIHIFIPKDKLKSRPKLDSKINNLNVTNPIGKKGYIKDVTVDGDPSLDDKTKITKGDENKDEDRGKNGDSKDYIKNDYRNYDDKIRDTNDGIRNDNATGSKNGYSDDDSKNEDSFGNKNGIYKYGSKGGNSTTTTEKYGDPLQSIKNDGDTTTDNKNGHPKDITEYSDAAFSDKRTDLKDGNNEEAGGKNKRYPDDISNGISIDSKNNEDTTTGVNEVTTIGVNEDTTTDVKNGESKDNIKTGNVDFRDKNGDSHDSNNNADTISQGKKNSQDGIKNGSTNSKNQDDIKNNGDDTNDDNKNEDSKDNGLDGDMDEGKNQISKDGIKRDSPSSKKQDCKDGSKNGTTGFTEEKNRDLTTLGINRDNTLGGSKDGGKNLDSETNDDSIVGGTNKFYPHTYTTPYASTNKTNILTGGRFLPHKIYNLDKYILTNISTSRPRANANKYFRSNRKLDGNRNNVIVNFQPTKKDRINDTFFINLKLNLYSFP